MRRYVLCLTLCHFVPFSIAITSLREERANLSAFRTFFRFVLVWICRFPLPLGDWEGLRFVIVALPGLFSYLFFILLTILLQRSRYQSYSLLLFGLFYEAVRFNSCLLLFCFSVFQSFEHCDYLAWGRES